MKIAIGLSISTVVGPIDRSEILPDFGYVFVYTSNNQQLLTTNGLYIQVLQSYINN